MPVGGDPPRRDVVVVVLTWNGLAYTRRCLESVHAFTTHPRHRVMVVDNGSTDGTVAYVEGLAGIEVLANGVNLGYAGGNNRALTRLEPGTDVVLLNNDVEALEPGWLERLQDCARSDSAIGVVGCRLRRPDGRLLHAGTYMPTDTFHGQQIGSEARDVGQYSAPVRDVEGVVFACVYLTAEVLEQVGLLDEGYDAYFEDTDYCLRALQAGFRVVCCGTVTMLHHEHVSTSVNGVDFGGLFAASQARFRARWEGELRDRVPTARIAWHSTLGFGGGYAVSSRAMAVALEDLGAEITYRYVYGPGSPYPFPEPDATESDRANRIMRRPLDPAAVQVVYGQGDILARNTGPYRIGYTMLEVDGIPAEWARQANLMHEMWAPTDWGAQVLIDSGVTRPVHVMPLGFDPDHFHPGITGFSLDGTFAFLSVFEWGERKAPELLMRAFSDEFGDDEPVVLVCKTSNPDATVSVVEEVAALGLRPRGGRVVMSIGQRIPDHELGALYRSADCFVLPTRGEGWGLPVLEAMACGLPVITTDWGGTTAFLEPGIAYPLEIERLVPAVARCPYYDGFRWAEPSYEHLRATMRHVFEHRQEAAAVGAAAAAAVHERWTWRHSAARLLARVQEVEQELSSSRVAGAHG